MELQKRISKIYTCKFTLFQETLCSKILNSECRRFWNFFNRDILPKLLCDKTSPNSHKKTRVKVSFLINLKAVGLKPCYKEILAQEFSCEFCKFFQGSFFIRNTWETLKRYFVLLFSLIFK